MWDTIYLLADDLTGLAETLQAVMQPLAQQGITYRNQVYPTLTTQALPLACPYTVIGVNTEERSLPSTPTVLAGLTSHHSFNTTFLYQKMDSTLRGWWAYTAQAWLTAPVTPAVTLVWCCPAYPQQGRTTLNGYHYLNQQLLHQTALAQDPSFPIHTPLLATYLANAGVNPQSVYTITVEAINQHSITEWVERLQQVLQHPTPPQWILQDATTPEHLQKMATVVQRLQQTAQLPQTLFLGCAGWANALAQHIGPCLKPMLPDAPPSTVPSTPIATQQPPTVVPPKPRLRLVVSGSVNPVTLQQLSTLRNTHTPFPQQWISCWQEETTPQHPVYPSNISAETLLVLTTCTQPTEKATTPAQQAIIWETLQQQLQYVFAQYQLDTIICCGGETSLLALKTANTPQLTSSYATNNSTAFPTFYDTTGCAWVFKSGNMGNDTTLLSLLPLVP